MTSEPSTSVERVSDLLALTYIDDLLSQSTPPRPLQFIFQRLLVVSSRASLGAAEHAVTSLLSLIDSETFPLHPLPRPHLLPATAASLLHLIIKFTSEDRSGFVEDSLIRGGARLSHSLSIALAAKGIKRVSDFSQAIVSRMRQDASRGGAVGAVNLQGLVSWQGAAINRPGSASGLGPSAIRSNPGMRQDASRGGAVGAVNLQGLVSWQGAAINRPGSASGLGPSAIRSNRGGITGGGLSATNVDTLLCATNEAGSTVADPREDVLEKVSFLFNNLAVSNLNPKRDEIRMLIQEEGETFLHWLAQYIVMRRVSVEQNFQPLYNQFICSIDNLILDRLIKEETFRNIKILLRNVKRQAASNYNERQLLKNLGLWLGTITIAKNRPIVITDLDLKSLLLEAYYKGQQELLYVIPFIAKILLSCGKSQLFTPSCAWIRALLKLLAELHNEPDLKINLKFEIEILCKELAVDLASLPNEGVLKDTDRLVRVPQQLSDLKTLTAPTAVAAGASPIPSQLRGGGMDTLPGPGGPDTNHSTPVQDEGVQAAVGGQPQPGEGSLDAVPAAAATAVLYYSDMNVVSYEGISPHIKIPASLPLFQMHPQLKQVVKVAVTQSIKELITPVTDRALKVALTVTETVVKKDFALCNDDDQMRKAAHNMMRAMTAAMAAITCRDPLSASLFGYLNTALTSGTRGNNSEALTKMIEEAAIQLTQENVEVTANFIVKTACEKATMEMEKRLEGELQARRNSRRDNAGKFGDAASIQAQSIMPEKLRIRSGSISNNQMAVYDEFAATICGFKSSTPQIKCKSSNQMGSAASSTTSTTEATPAIPARIEDTPEMNAKVDVILRDWIALCYTPMCQKDPQQALSNMIHLMHEQGVLATDDMITRFFRLCTELCIDVGYRLLKNEPMSTNSVVRQRCYYTLDAFVKLTCLMVKHSDGSQHQTKINLLKKVLTIMTTVLHTDHQAKLPKGDFQAMPYHRMIIIMFNELTAPDANLEPIAWLILEAFGQTFFILQPYRVPGFAYAWLDIIGHRNVISRLLGGVPNGGVDPMRTQAMYTQLLICHLKFIAPFLRNLELPKTIQMLYKGTLRVLLAILHDFPELLCDYHYALCDAIPPNCVQLRNLVLSAYPRNMRLPDPFAISFKLVDSIQEMSNDPKMCLNINTIMSPDLRQHLDQYLQHRTGVEFLQQLPSLLQLSDVPGKKYNSTVVNAVVLYVGVRAIEDLRSRNLRVSVQNIAHCSYMDIFQNLTVQLCTEGRYILFNAIANQLRYPNIQTHYFSCVFLFLFLNSDSPAIQEQITRILFERLVALRPHPWGLLITFIELINNPAYNFWKNDFTRCAHEIERLFQNVASTCLVKNPSAQVAMPPASVASPLTA